MSGSGSAAQFKQLPMFMSAHEIRSQYRPWEGDRELTHTPEGVRDETNDELWARKRHEASLGVMPTLDEQILKEGVKNPIPLQHVDPWWHGNAQPQIMGGHHRLAVMYEHKPHDLMPVEHFEDFKDVQRSESRREQADIEQRAKGRRWNF